MTDASGMGTEPAHGDFGPALEELTETECHRLLAAGGLGRVAVTVRALPHIFPVNYVVDGTDVVFVSGRGSKLAAATRQAVVAFEIDGLDSIERTGWSVEVTGTSSVVTDPEELDRYRCLPLAPWAHPDRGCFIRIRPAAVTGRRITYAADRLR